MAEFIPTRSSSTKNKETEFKVITYKSHKPKGNKRKIAQDPAEGLNQEAINLKKLKHEVVRFGMSGFDAQKKEEAKVRLAIELGAKPKKNKYINYKKLLQEKKLEKIDQQSQLDFQQLGKNKIGKSNAKGKTFDRKRRKNEKLSKVGLLDAYGKVKIKTK